MNFENKILQDYLSDLKKQCSALFTAIMRAQKNGNREVLFFISDHLDKQKIQEILREQRETGATTEKLEIASVMLFATAEGEVELVVCIKSSIFYNQKFTQNILCTTAVGIQRELLEQKSLETVEIKNELDMAIQSAKALLKGFAAEGTDGPFEVTLDFLLKTLSIDHGSIWEYHDNGDLTLEAVRNCPIERYTHNIIHKSRGIVAAAFLPDAPRIIKLTNIDSSKLVNKQLFDIYQHRDIYIVRLGTLSTPIGVAVLVSGRSPIDRFKTLERASFDQFLTLELQAKRRTQQLNLFTAIKELLQSDHHTVGLIAKNLCTKLMGIINCQGVSIFLKPNLDNAGAELILVASCCADNETPSIGLRQFLDGGQLITYSIGLRSLTGKVAFTRKPIVTNDISKEPENSNRYREILDTANQSWIGVPIINSRDECIGVIRCTGKKTTVQGKSLHYVFDGMDRELLVAASAIIAPMLLHSHTADTLRDVNEGLQDAENIREHEMRGPLQIIWNNADFVERNLDNISATSKPYKLNSIKTNVALCSSLLTSTDLPDQKAIAVGLERASLHKMLQSLVDIFTYQITAKSKGSVKVDMKTGTITKEHIPFMKVELMGTCPFVVIHKDLIQRAFYNIGSNAIKYSRPDAVGRLIITLSYDSNAQSAVITFEDIGMGVTDEEADKIFKGKFRGKSAQSKPGKGLGLKLARRILELHGGSLVLKNNRNPTIFECRIPPLRPFN